MTSNVSKDFYTKFRTPILLALNVLIVLGPVLFFSSYRLFEFSMLAIYGVVLVGLNLLTGFNGQISIGHGAFYALGAYFGALSLPYFGDYYLLVLPLSAVFGLVIGYVIGRPALRFEGPFMALVTFALAISVPQTIEYFEKFTGGISGVRVKAVMAPSWTGLSPDQWVYVMAGTMAVLMFYFANNLVKSQFGRAIVAIRDNPVAASTMGVDVDRYKVITFAISVMYASVAGCMLPFVVHFVAPGTFHFTLSIFLLSAIVLGGIASRMGPVYGALYMQYLPNIATSISLGAPAVVSGLLIILVINLSPGGINGLVFTVMGYLKNFKKQT
jgi:branched-chain amino acid transport system permease protein